MRPANMVSFARILLMVINFLLASRLSPLENSLIVAFVYVMDVFDGFVARRLGSTPFGEFMDIMVDRIITLSYFAFHLSRNTVPFWFFFLVLARNIIVDYVFYFRLISEKKLERHKLTSGIFRAIYTSRASRYVNGLLQGVIAMWGFFSPVPAWLLLLFLLNSYIRAVPNFLELIHRF